MKSSTRPATPSTPPPPPSGTPTQAGLARPSGTTGAAGKQNRKRPMELGDAAAAVEQAPTLDMSSMLAVPELTEARIHELHGALQQLEGEPTPDVAVSDAMPLPAKASGVVTTDSPLMDVLASVKPGAPGSRARGKRPGTSTQGFTATSRQDAGFTLRAMYRKMHGVGLRAHEEMAAHIGANIADVIHAEQLFELPGVGMAGTRSKAAGSTATKTPADSTTPAASSLGGGPGTSPGVSMPPTPAALNAESLGVNALNPFQRATIGLPPLAIFLLRAWTTSTHALRRFFGYKATSGDGTRGPSKAEEILNAGGPVGLGLEDDTQKRAALVRKLRELIALGADNGRPTGESDFHRDVSAALQQRDVDAMARWSGTCAVLIGAIEHIHARLLAEAAVGSASAAASPTIGLISPGSEARARASPALTSGSGKRSDASPAGGKKKQGRSPDKSARSGSMAALKASQSAEEHAVPHVHLTHTLKYEDSERARGAMERAIAAYEPMQTVLDAPLLLPFHVTAEEPLIPSLQRVEGYVQPNPDLNDAKQPRSKPERAQILCDGYDRDDGLPHASRVTIVVLAPLDAFVPLAPFLFSATERLPAMGGKRSSSLGNALAASTLGVPDDSASVLSAGSGSFLPTKATGGPSSRRGGGGASIGRRMSVLSMLTPRPATTPMSPAVLPPRATLRFESFDPAQQKLVFRIGAPRQPVDPGDLSLFLDTALADAVKADHVASKLHTRLALRFVRPHHCRRHTAQKFAFFCRTCRQFICRACRGERHAHHDTVAHASFCADEVNALGTKRALVLGRLQVLRRIRDELPNDEGRMHATVDGAIDDVVERLEDRRRALHADANARVRAWTDALHAEQESWEREQEAVLGALAIIAEAKAGRVAAVPANPPRVPNTLKDGVSSLRLPTKELKLLARVLRWSNPSQYLTSAIYPPTDEEMAAADEEHAADAADASGEVPLFNLDGDAS